ncbi:MAG TPA: MarR family transcriptional regulator [Spirochaetia bacterium]|nr:MarR family transcriptional regulator [Spirochaetia bacterium]
MKPTETAVQQTVDVLLDALPAVWDRIRSRFRAAATGTFGITLEQFHVLRHIRKGYQSVGELAEKRQISRSAISQAVEVLVEKGLVTRQQQSADRRCFRLGLTPHAAAVLEANSHEIRGWMGQTLAGSGVDELKRIQSVLATLKKTFAPEESRA